MEPMNPTVMQTYRDTLQVGSAPSFIDSSEKIIPVAVVAGAVTANVTLTPLLSAPSSSQTLVRASNGGKAGTAITAGTGVLVYTVTAGKTLYVTGFMLSTNSGTNWELRDGTTIAGTVKASGQNCVGNMPVLPPGCLMSFTSGVFLDVTPSATYGWVLVGFEQ